MTFMGGLTEVVGVIGRFGLEVVMLAFVVVKPELVDCDFEVVTLEDELEEPLRLLLDDIDDVLEFDEDLLEICVFACCWSCCLHFALRFLNQTYWQRKILVN